MFRSTLLQSTRLARAPLRAQPTLWFTARPLTTTRIAFHPSSGSTTKPNPHVDPQHATGTAKDEVKALARDLAGMIGGGSAKARELAADAAAGARENVHAQGSIEQDFVSTGRVMRDEMEEEVSEGECVKAWKRFIVISTGGELRSQFRLECGFALNPSEFQWLNTTSERTAE